MEHCVIKETDKENVCIRMHRYVTDSGEVKYGIEITAWNAWANQAKLLEFTAGLNIEEATSIFDECDKWICGYDWTARDFEFNS